MNPHFRRSSSLAEYVDTLQQSGRYSFAALETRGVRLVAGGNQAGRPFRQYTYGPAFHRFRAGIDSLQNTDPPRAATLYATFLAGCREEAEDPDDSSGSFNQFAKNLICRGEEQPSFLDRAKDRWRVKGGRRTL